MGAQQGRSHLDPPARRHQNKPTSAGIGLEVLGGHLGRMLQPIPEDPRLGRLGEVAAGLLVGVEDGGRLRLEARKQPSLRLPVGDHVGVVVEVFGRKVREGPHVEGDAGRPALVEGVAGDLHDGRLQTHLQHLGEVGGEDVGVGRREAARNLPPTDDRAEGPHQPRGPTGGLQNGPGQVGRGRLARGAGHPAHRQAPRRVARQGMSRQGEGLPPIGDQDHRPAARQGRRTLDHGRHRPGLQRRLDEPMTVHLRPHQGDEEVPRAARLGRRPDLPRVVHDAAHLHFARTDEPGPWYPLDHLGQFHGLTWGAAPRLHGPSGAKSAGHGVGRPPTSRARPPPPAGDTGPDGSTPRYGSTSSKIRRATGAATVPP